MSHDDRDISLIVDMVAHVHIETENNQFSVLFVTVYVP